MKEVFEKSLHGDNRIGYLLGRIASEEHPGKALVDGVGDPFDLLEYAAEGLCEAKLAANVHAEMETSWQRESGLHCSPLNAVYDVQWQGRTLRVLIAHYRVGFDNTSESLVIADDESTARHFIEEVCAFCNEPHRAVLLFNGGCFSKSREMFESIQASTFDDLVLAGDLKTNIQEDFLSFMKAKPEYERFGVPYKRGVLFLGPPGNGKTHCLRATLRLLGLPTLYVLSLKAKYVTEDSNIEKVFRRARELTPCCLVFEDLDAMIHDQNRSFFLNQLDGLGNLSGVLTIATTNHPERLDPSILERPSRFDRKYHFTVPGPVERDAHRSQRSREHRGRDARFLVCVSEGALSFVDDALDG